MTTAPVFFGVVGLTALIASALLGFSGLVLLLVRRRRALLSGGLQLVVSTGVAYLYLKADLPARWVSLDPSARESLAGAAATLFWLSVALALTGALSRYVWEGALRRPGRPDVPALIRQLADFLVYLGCLMVIARFVYDKPITGLLATSGVVAVILGYSAQATLAQAFAGLSLSLSGAFKEGEWICVDGVDGQVVQSNWRAITLWTFAHTLVTVPNTLVAQSTITNYDRPRRHFRRHVDFWADYDVPPPRVTELATQAMLHSAHVCKDPKPFTIGFGFGDYGVQYRAYWYVVNADSWLPDVGDVVSGIWHAFDRAGIRFGYARRQLGWQEPAPPQPPLAGLDAAELLRSVALFRALSQEELAALAATARHRRHGPPERIIEQGQPGESLFVVARGNVVISTRLPDGTEADVATLGPGQCFGTMSLLTGEPRSASARASEVVDVLEIGKGTFQRLLQRRPELVREIAFQVAAWQLENERRSEAHSQSHAALAERQTSLMDSLSSKILRFFGVEEAGEPDRPEGGPSYW